MTMTYGERLRKALDHRGIGQRAFARRIKELGVVGGSYRSISNYLTGVFTPSLEWTQAAAEILGVSETWLGSDEGQMLPTTTLSPNTLSCIRGLDSLKPSLSMLTHTSTFDHLRLAHDRFADVFGDTRGMKGAEAKNAYAAHLFLPLKTLLLHVRGSEQFENVGLEKIRHVLNQYLELVLLLMPKQEDVDHNARKAVSRSLSEWRKQREFLAPRQGLGEEETDPAIADQIQRLVADTAAPTADTIAQLLKRVSSRRKGKK